MLWVGIVCSCTLCGVLLSSLWPCSVHKHPCLRVPEDIAQYQQRILSEPGVSSQETKRLWEGRCVQKHQDLARTGRNGPSKHRERLLASSPYSNNDHGIGITKSLFNAGSWHFYTDLLSMCEREVFWKDDPKNLSDCEKNMCAQLKITNIKRERRETVLRDSFF